MYQSNQNESFILSAVEEELDSVTNRNADPSVFGILTP